MSRRSIHQLPPNLVNRIAAGEVIERPASVVKELVENAVDAGATRIIVEVEDGGRELIRVIDDGGGIPANELPLAFASHATSKLVSDDDLFDIRTLGFRGEALASIGSVAHARILSRSRESNDPSAYEIFNRGGEVSDPQAAAGNAGTTIEIRNLFFNTPARRKFMRGSSTEFGYISEQLLRTALPHPSVHFTLSHNNRVVLDLPATSDEQTRWLAAWPADFRELKLPIQSRDAEVKLRGIIGLPELARPVSKHLHIYLNGRWIRDKSIQHAAREAYRGLTEPGRYPAAVLMLEMPPSDVDVNVHPTKVEVRFRDSGRIHGLVMAVIRERLLGSDLTPAAVPMRNDAVVADDQNRLDMQSKLAAFFRGQFETPMNAVQQPRLIETFPVEQRATVDARSEASEHRPTNAFETPSRAGAVPNSESIAPQALPLNGEREPVGHSEGASTFAPRMSEPNGTAIQLHNSYLIAESADGLVIIDQHALHERIIFEDLLVRITRGPLESQRLLLPLTLPASARQIALIEQIQPLLARLGIDVAPFGPATLAVSAFPSFLERLDPVEFVRELLERGEQELLDLHEEGLLHNILDMMSCKAAVKAGDPLTPGEIAALLARRELVERSSNCPHGRPTTLRLSLRDLEKQFKRTGF
jgi:DNA mismatch repair protein MutL